MLVFLSDMIWLFILVKKIRGKKVKREGESICEFSQSDRIEIFRQSHPCYSSVCLMMVSDHCSTTVYLSLSCTGCKLRSAGQWWWQGWEHRPARLCYRQGEPPWKSVPPLTPSQTSSCFPRSLRGRRIFHSGRCLHLSTSRSTQGPQMQRSQSRCSGTDHHLLSSKWAG